MPSAISLACRRAAACAWTAVLLGLAAVQGPAAEDCSVVAVTENPAPPLLSGNFKVFKACAVVRDLNGNDDDYELVVYVPAGEITDPPAAASPAAIDVYANSKDNSNHDLLSRKTDLVDISDLGFYPWISLGGIMQDWWVEICHNGQFLSIYQVGLDGNLQELAQVVFKEKAHLVELADTDGDEAYELEVPLNEIVHVRLSEGGELGSAEIEVAAKTAQLVRVQFYTPESGTPQPFQFVAGGSQ